jgi:NAD-dependent SIR2 family protein deacetylase
MIDPLVSLAFAIHANKGAYVVLLGSGVSRTAGIKTGWEIVLDLIGKVASASNEDPGSDPASWYRRKYSRDPDYSELLDELCRSSGDRRGLLQDYFEPNADERAQGLKVPTKAHKAIAKLVAGGYVRVVVTTNFDRLMERALQDEGLTPEVVSSADGFEGMSPLPHQKCCVVKLHGDYLDHRFKKGHD